MTLTLEHLFLAYRQAKRSIVSERRGTGLAEFANYERNLHDNLTVLFNALVSGDWFDALPRQPRGRLWLIPKGVSALPATDAVERIGPSSHTQKQIVDVRFLYTPSVELAICEVLYLEKFGPALETALLPHAVGNRLSLKGGSSQGVFKFWPREYARFREEPLRVAQALLEDTTGGQRCRLISTDFSAYYDSLDPRFMISDEVVSQCFPDTGAGGAALQSEYLRATRSLLSIHDEYRRHRNAIASRAGSLATLGIPIGMLTSRVVANLALRNLDRYIVAHDSVRCYLRYVDDIVVVDDHPDGAISSVTEAIGKIMPLVAAPRTATRHRLRLNSSTLGAANSILEFQEKKVKVYELSSNEGLDFLKGVARELRQVSSEARTFWDPRIASGERLAERARASEGTHARTVVRSSDRTKIANYELAATLSSLKGCLCAISPAEASVVSRRSLAPIAHMLEDVLQWSRRLELFHEALQLAVLATDWETTIELLRQSDAAWGDVAALRGHVSALRWNEREVQNDRMFSLLRDYLHRKRIEALLAALPMKLPEELRTTTLRVGQQAKPLADFAAAVTAFVAADLRALDREDEYSRGNVAEHSHSEIEAELANTQTGERLDTIRRFLAWRTKAADMAWGQSATSLFLSRRPPTYFDVAVRYFGDMHLPTSKDVFEQIVSTVNACRGTNYRRGGGEVLASPADVDTLWLDVEAGPSALLRAIVANLRLSEEYWKASVAGTPCQSLRRYNDLADVLDNAQRASRARKHGDPRPPPSILILPELALPRAWTRTLARYIASQRYHSVVSGVEYQLTPPTVRSQALGIFLGPYKSVAAFLWTKGNPADEERRGLTKFGLSFSAAASSARKTILNSNLGRFVVLICSELIEPQVAAPIVGRVELVVAPVWNRDVLTYDHLVRSVSLQVHAYVAVANSSSYSDSRIWGPLAARHLMDVCRLVHRDQNSVVWADLPLRQLEKVHLLGHSLDPDSPDAKPWKPLPPRMK